MRNKKSVDKIIELTKDKYDMYFISELLFKFKNLTGTQTNTIKNILYFNNLSTIEELERHINNCFSYSGSKSSADYKKYMYGADGFNKWQEEMNKTREDSKTKNLKDPEYIKNMYCGSIEKETGYKYKTDFIYELIKDYVPLSEMVRDIIIRVLNLNRFNTVDEYYANIKSLVEYKGSRSNNNSEYGIMLLGNDGYNEYMNKAVSLSKETKKENFLNNIDSLDRYTKIAKTIIKKTSCGYNKEFIANIMKSTKDFDIENELHKRWLSDQVYYFNYDTIEEHSKNLNDIINFTGNRKHSFEWEVLRFGKEEAENRRLVSSYIFSSLNNPNMLEARYNNCTIESKLHYIKCLFDKNSDLYVNKKSIDIEQTFYIINVTDDIYKVGITRDFNKRFFRHKYNKLVMLYETNLYEALLLEIIFKILYCENSIEENKDYGYTETFSNLNEETMIDRFNKIRNIIDKEIKKEA